MSNQMRDRLSPKEAATYLNVSESTLAKWRLGNDGPPYHFLGRRRIYYFADEIDAWLAECDRRGGARTKI